MFLLNNLKFLFKNKDKKAFCELNKIPYRTFQDVYLGKTKDPRLSFIISISKAINISIDKLIFNDLEKETNLSE